MEGLEYFDEESMNELMNDALNDDYSYNYDCDYESDNEKFDKYADKKIQYYCENSHFTEYEQGINEIYRESKPEFQKFIILEYTKILHSTELAWKFGRIDGKNGETEFWIPKSLCELNEEDNLIAFPLKVMDWK